jgi:DNA-binding response OmpR family regulator
MALQSPLLLVEDEPNLAKVLAARLQREGVDTMVAASLSTALNLLENTSICGVVLDSHLPDSIGFQTLDIVVPLARPAPVLCITAYEEQGLLRSIMERGAVDLVYKPFDLDLLTAQVLQIIGRGRQRPGVERRSTPRQPHSGRIRLLQQETETEIPGVLLEQNELGFSAALVNPVHIHRRVEIVAEEPSSPQGTAEVVWCLPETRTDGERSTAGFRWLPK